MPYTTTDQHESGMSANRARGGAESDTGTALQGMKAICNYAGKSENTLRKLIQDEGFPAKKVGGEWMSDTGLVDAWRLEKVVSKKCC